MLLFLYPLFFFIEQHVELSGFRSGRPMFYSEEACHK